MGFVLFVCGCGIQPAPTEAPDLDGTMEAPTAQVLTEIPTETRVPAPTQPPKSVPTAKMVPTLASIRTQTSTPRLTPTPNPLPIPIKLHLSNGGVGEYSKLWGESGELWNPRGRLPDFSYAGYHMGEDPIPDVPVKLNVRDFGAQGDGITDDSQAFLQAIAEIDDGAIYIPSGRYKLTQVLDITKSTVVLQGAGVDDTVLYFPKNLGEVLGPGNAPPGTPDWSAYSWRDGFIRIKGKPTRSTLVDVVGAASRGDSRIRISSASEFDLTEMVGLYQSDPGDGSYLKHLHAEQLDGGNPNIVKSGARFISKVKDIEGSTIELERPLRTDVRVKWGPVIHSYIPSLQEVGIENLTMEFPEVRYTEHHKEPGYNGIQILNAANCWVRNLKFLNADNGIFLDFSRFCTIANVYFGAYEARAVSYRADVVSGHHAMKTYRGADNLFTGFEVNTRFIHDITLGAGSNGNVFSKGKGIDLNFDHHRRAPFENLFTDIDAGRGGRLWERSGTTDIGRPHSGARETFWNIKTTQPYIAWPKHSVFDDASARSVPWGPDQMNLVGVTTNDPSTLTEDSKWFEVIDPDELFPQDLHLAQLAKRLRVQSGR